MKNIATVLFSMVCLSAFAQRADFNFELVSNVDYTEECNDIWGFVDNNGIEYAILGTTEATAILSLEDPAAPIERAYIPGATSIWRDMKSIGNHVYVTTDQGEDGLLSINMTHAPDSITWSYNRPSVSIDGNVDTMLRSHNLYANEDEGYLYISGANINNGGILIMDAFTNPDTPVIVGVSDARYSHDVYQQGNLLYSSDIGDGFFSVIDITDIENPVTLATQRTTSDFTHNAWASDDGNFLFTTDERPNGRVDAYDISDLDNIERLDDWRPRATLDRGVIPHNTHYLDGYLITSYYSDGIKITDVNRPSNMVEVGSYDTFLGADGGFNGCWGAYPYLPSGLVLASDIQRGLFVLRPTYERASYIEGDITDAVTGSPINAAEITITGVDVPIVELSRPTGAYAAGVAGDADVIVTVTHPEYFPGTATAALVAGEVTLVDVALEPRPKFVFSGTVTDAATGEGIEDASVLFVSSTVPYEARTDADGNYSVAVLTGTARVTAGVWGYNQRLFEEIAVNEDTGFDIELDEEYRDDFVIDLGWRSTGTASTGLWVQAEPNGTFFRGSSSQTGMDLEGDLGNEMYITGNTPGGVGVDDVDNGTAILMTPSMDLAQYEEPVVEYTSWFFNEGGENTPDDALEVTLETADTIVILETITESLGEFRPRSVFMIDTTISGLEDCRIVFTTSDLPATGNLVEAGIDAFYAYDGMTISTREVAAAVKSISLVPNPATYSTTIVIEEMRGANLLRVVSASGQVVQLVKNADQVTVLDLSMIGAGTYFVQHYREGRYVSTEKLVVMGRE